VWNKHEIDILKKEAYHFQDLGVDLGNVKNSS
jgi:hypothetical protein